MFQGRVFKETEETTLLFKGKNSKELFIDPVSAPLKVKIPTTNEVVAILKGSFSFMFRSWRM